MQETSDGGRAGTGVLCNTSHNPLPVGVMDHDSPTQSDHHEEEGGAEMITGRTSISHSKNMADSRHCGTLVMKQGHLPDSLTSSASTRAFKDDEPDSPTSIGLTRMSKDPELDTTTLSTKSDLVAPTLPTCGPSTQESPDRASASLLRKNTSHDPLSVDHDSSLQSDHHEEERATQPSSISHPKNVAEWLEQQYLSDPLTSTGSPEMFKAPELDTATSDTSSVIVVATFRPLPDEHQVLVSEHHEVKPELKSELRKVEEELCQSKKAEHAAQEAKSFYCQTVVRLQNEKIQLQQTIQKKDKQLAERDQTIQKKDKQLAERDQTIQKKDKRIAQMLRSIQVLKKQPNMPTGEKRSMETVGKDHVLRSYKCDGQQVIEIKGATEDNR